MKGQCIEQDILRIKELLSDVLGTEEYAAIERLGGLTNHTYKVELADKKLYVVRLPGEGTEKLINRRDEKISTQLACDLDIDAQMLYFGENGEKVTQYIPGAQTMCIAAFQDHSNLKKAAGIFRKLHSCSQDTHVPFEVFEIAAGYEAIIQNNHVDLFEDYSAIKAQIMRIKAHVDRSSAPRVPCHNDPLCENWVLDADGRMYLIDWEYAGMNDGMWDLADLSIEANFSAIQDEALLMYYLERKPESDELIRFHANKLYLDYLWSLWGKARVPFDGQPMEDYALERYVRLKENLRVFFNNFSIN